MTAWRPLSASARASRRPSGWSPRIAKRIATITPDSPERATAVQGCFMNPDWQARYALMVRAAREAGRHALTYYPDLQAADFAAQVIWTGDNSPVTVADRAAAAHPRHVLLGAYPDDGTLAADH